MIQRVISGGQTGADQAGWRAAERAGIATGGWMPRGFLTEEGPRPEFAERYGAREHESPEFPPRTRANVADADATLIVAPPSPGPGTRLTRRACREAGRPAIEVHLLRDPVDGRPALHDPDQGARWVAEWIVGEGVRVLNVAGPRESEFPGIGEWVEAFLLDVFGRLGPVPGEDRGPLP